MATARGWQYMLSPSTVVHAVEFTRRNGDVAGWTEGGSERRGTKMQDCSDIGGPGPPG